MTYPRFERVAIVLSAVIVLATTLVTLRPFPGLIEIVAQLLVLLVLVGALHWGRRGGAAAGVIAAVAYILMRTPDITLHGFTPQLTWLVAIRVVTYGLIGVVGGDLCGRLKYVLAELDDSAALDRVTGVYSHGYVARAAREALGLFERYATPFSIVFVDAPEPPARRYREGARTIASHLREAVRLVDDVGRLADGRFVLLLHHTSRSGADTVMRRVRAVFRDSPQLDDEGLRTDLLGTPEDLIALRTFVADLAQTTGSDESDTVDGPEPQPSSGA